MGAIKKYPGHHLRHSTWALGSTVPECATFVLGKCLGHIYYIYICDVSIWYVYTISSLSFVFNRMIDVSLNLPEIMIVLTYLGFLPMCPIWTVWGKIERFQQKLNGNMAHLPRATVSFFLAIDLEDQQCLPDETAWIGDGTVQEPFAKFAGLDSNQHGLTGLPCWFYQ